MFRVSGNIVIVSLSLRIPVGNAAGGAQTISTQAEISAHPDP
jgi:hypothetical protein